jgi:intein/homing endonuclease
MITKVDEGLPSSIPIEKIKIGDEALSFNPDGEIKIAKVIKIHVAKANQIFVLSTKGNEVKVTGEHPFLTEKGVFKKVKDLKVGEKIFVLCDDGLCEETILDKKEFDREAEVYNLTVDGNNTFFADGFAVHNKVVP